MGGRAGGARGRRRVSHRALMCRFVLSAARAGKQDNQSDMADQQAAGGLHYRTVSVSNGQDNAKQVKIVTLVDKRIAPPGAAQEWLFQADLENMLYPSAAVNGTNGAFY